MSLVLTEEQQLLKESADGFFAEKSPVSDLRDLRDRADDIGYRPELWSEMADMGFVGLMIPEDAGGADFGYVGAGIVAEAMGRQLTASPFLAHSVIATALLKALGAGDLLADLASGDRLYTVALDEGTRFDIAATALSAEVSGDGYTLSGLKTFVPEGHVADRILVVARTSGAKGDTSGLSVFLVEKGASGLITDRVTMADSRNWAKLTLSNTPAVLVGELDGAYGPVVTATDHSNLVIASELLGISEQCLQQTTAYLKERQQFGVVIGTFQALQHRAAHLFTEIAMTRSAVLKAQQAADQGGDIASYAAIAKARAVKSAELATNEAIQMHGGIGMTDEYDIGFYIKRARPLAHLFGDYNYQTERFATLSGY